MLQPSSGREHPATASDNIYVAQLQKNSPNGRPTNITETWADIRNRLNISQTDRRLCLYRERCFLSLSSLWGEHAVTHEQKLLWGFVFFFFLNCICFTWHWEWEWEGAEGKGGVCVSGPPPVDSSAGYRWTLRTPLPRSVSLWDCFRNRKFIQPLSLQRHWTDHPFSHLIRGQTGYFSDRAEAATQPLMNSLIQEEFSDRFLFLFLSLNSFCCPNKWRPPLFGNSVWTQGSPFVYTQTQQRWTLVCGPWHNTLQHEYEGRRNNRKTWRAPYLPRRLMPFD